jgi:TonB-dependent receptor
MKNPTYRTSFKLSTLVVAMSIGLAGVDNAVAQEQAVSSDDVETINVKGIRGSLAKAIATKRGSVQFIDAITADDIGKLPDANVAESLQRVSGVQIDRGIGGGSDVSIRGLRNNVILVNGRQVIEGGGRGSRGPDTLESSSYGLLAIMPAKLISRLEVTKQAGSEQIEGALGGVVNIITRKPLDKSGQHAQASVTGINSDLSGDTGYEAFGLYSNTFGDDTLGIQLSAVVADQEVQEDGLNTFTGFSLLSTDDVANSDPNGDGIPGLINRDMRFWQINDQRSRIGVNAIVQYRPTDSSEYYLDTFYSKLESDRERYWTAFSPKNISNPVFSPNDVLLSADVMSPLQTNTEFADASSEFTSTALGGKWFNDKWTASSELTYTTSESLANQQFARFQGGTSAPQATKFDFRAGDVPSLIYNTNDLTGLAGLTLNVMFDSPHLRDNKTADTAVRVDFTRHLDGDVSSFEFGLRYNITDTDIRGAQNVFRPGAALDDISNLVTIYSNDNYFSGDADIPSAYPVLNEDTWQGCKSISSYLNAATAAICANTASIFEKSREYSIGEDIAAFYTKANFDMDVDDTRVSGNFGLRYVDRKLTADGFLQQDGSFSPYQVTRSDKELLPSAVVKIDWSDDVVIRAGLARVLSFPTVADMNTGLSLNANDRGGSGGNPMLNPSLINQADVSLEWYFNAESLLSVGLFYKDVDSFIINEAQNRNVPGLGEYFIRQPINGEGGSIKGFEFLYQQPFTGMFENMGMMATYSYINSQTPFTDNFGRSLPIPGLSENNINLVMYYEVDAFGFRVAYNWRDEYLDSINGATGGTGIFFKSYDDLVVSARWNISDNVSLGFEGVNLLNSRQEKYNAYPEALRSNVESGAVYKATVSVNF